MGEGSPDPESRLQPVLRLLYGNLLSRSFDPVQLGMDGVVFSLLELGLTLSVASAVLGQVSSEIAPGSSLEAFEELLRSHLKAVNPDWAKRFDLPRDPIRRSFERRFDRRVGEVVGPQAVSKAMPEAAVALEAAPESAPGAAPKPPPKAEEFKVDELARSLMEIDLGFLDILSTLEVVGPGLRPGMKTSKITQLVSDYLETREPGWANRFNALIRRGYEVEHPDGTREPLKHQVVKRIIDKGFREGEVVRGRQLLVGEGTRTKLAGIIVRRFRAQLPRVIKEVEIAGHVREELKLHWGREYGELVDDLQWLVGHALGELGRVHDIMKMDRPDQKKALPGWLERLEHATQAILLTYGYVPGLNRDQTFWRAAEMARETPRDGEQGFARHLAEYLHEERMAGRRLPSSELSSVNGILDQVGKAYPLLQSIERYGLWKQRRAGPANDKEKDKEREESRKKREQKREKEIGRVLPALSVLFKAVMAARPQDLGDATEKDKAAGDTSMGDAVIRHLFRHRYCDFYSLTHDLRLLPKYLAGVLKFLEREGYIEKHKLVHAHRLILELTQKGEEHGREDLGLNDRRI